MTRPNRVWVLEVGSYSDRHIHSVYSTEEAAEIAALAMLRLHENTSWRESVCVSPFDLDTTTYPSPITFYVATELYYAVGYKCIAACAEDVPKARHWVVPKGGGYTQARAFAVGVGSTPEAAKKSYDDHIAQCRAEMEGIA